MDMEGTAEHRKFVLLSTNTNAPRLSIPPFFQPKSNNNNNKNVKQQIQTLLDSYNMPWTSSIDSNYKESLTFMNFFMWQLDFMQEHLTELELLKNHDDTFTYHDNTQQHCRIFNMQFESREYRKIRLTYYDAGNKVQVFNSLWYPNHSNLPVLGVDLLAFNDNKKMLSVVDFQPLQQQNSSDDYDYYHDLMKPILLQHPKLEGSKMSNRFYDEEQFFSPYKLFTRFENSELIYSDVFPAYQKFVRAHVCELVKKRMNETTSQQHNENNLLSLHRAYDVYSADRDPAKAMFARVFGHEWADKFVHEFLFELSRVDDIDGKR
jgi:15,16-dihydrobiliverdin:ferredoxin oxidoreductase